MRSIFETKNIKHLLFSILSIISFEIYAQDKIELKQAGELSNGTYNGFKVRKLKYDVRFKQGETLVFCDSAYQYEDKNMLEAFGHVKIKQDNGTTITSNNLTYNGDTKIINFRGDVVLKDKSMTLTTPELDYNANDKTAIYNNGATIIDKDTKLTSRYGNYNTSSKLFTFKYNVRLFNKEHDLTTDTLYYKADIKTAYFKGPTAVKTKDGNLNSTDGEYRTDKNILTLKGKSQIENADFILSGNKVHFDNKKKEGDASGDVSITFKKEKVIVEGDKAIYRGKKNFTKVWGNGLMKSIVDNDTLYLKADTLISINDSINKNRKLVAIKKVRIFKKDIQGRCDSLVYNLQDSTINFFKDPVLWSDKSQMTGDSIKIQMANNKIDKLYLRVNSFIISKDSIENFNQIKGKKITAYFSDNKIQTVDVYGNGESIYFATEKDTVLVGMNKVICSNMLMRFKENKLKNISFLTKPDALFIPPHEILAPDARLKGFRWRISEIPLKKEMVVR
jgi:lipopolysaccharide export system protein LptA